MAYAADYSGGTYAGSYNVGRQILDQPVTLVRHFNCVTYNLTATSFYKLFAVPANFAVLEAYLITETAEGTDTVDLVDDDSATTTFVTNHTMSAGTVTATNARKLFTAAGYLVARPDANLTTGAFWIVVKGLILNTSM